MQDTLRGRPAFAIAANLPRRSGPTQLNHLIAALFAQGLPVNPEFLYARRRPHRLDLHERGEPARAHLELKLPRRERGHTGDAWGDETEDAEMLLFQETMRVFLETQQAVMAAYLAAVPAVESSAAPVLAPHESADSLASSGTTRSSAEPGPWISAVRRLVPGREVEAVYHLDAKTDPIAEHHTLGGRRVSALDPSLKGLPVLPFAVMAEMAAQAAALVVSPGLVLVKLVHLRAASGFDMRPSRLSWSFVA